MNLRIEGDVFGRIRSMASEMVCAIDDKIREASDQSCMPEIVQHSFDSVERCVYLVGCIATEHAIDAAIARCVKEQP